MSMLLRCFERVTVANQWSAPPISSNPFNVVKGAGWALIVCFAASSAILVNHRSNFLKQRTEELLKTGKYDLQPEAAPAVPLASGASSRCLESAPSDSPVRQRAVDSAPPKPPPSSVSHMQPAADAGAKPSSPVRVLQPVSPARIQP
eukprot:3660381-Prymnesium_polylepis.1